MCWKKSEGERQRERERESKGSAIALINQETNQIRWFSLYLHRQCISHKNGLQNYKDIQFANISNVNVMLMG